MLSKSGDGVGGFQRMMMRGRGEGSGEWVFGSGLLLWGGLAVWVVMGVDGWLTWCSILSKDCEETTELDIFRIGVWLMH